MAKTDKDFIPKNVKKQEDAAVAAQKAAAAAKKAPVTEPTKDPVIDPTAAPVTDAGAIPAAIPAAEPVVVGAAAEVPAVDPTKQAAEGFEQKYNVLQGMYNKDTHELKQQVVNMESAMAKSDAIIANLSNVIEKLPGQQVAAQAAAPAAQATPTLDSKEFKGYGDEMVVAIDLLNGLVPRIEALERAKPAVAGDNSELTSRVDNIEQTQQVSVKDTFYTALGKWNANWGTINHDPKFALWLEEIDPLSQVQRKVLLQYAFKQWNHTQVIALFSNFSGPAPVVDPNASAIPGAQVPGLAAQVVPEITGNSGDDPAGQPKVEYSTKDDFLKAKDDFVKGRITEVDFDKVSNSYQTGLSKAQKQQ